MASFIPGGTIEMEIRNISGPAAEAVSTPVSAGSITIVSKLFPIVIATLVCPHRWPISVSIF